MKYFISYLYRWFNIVIIKYEKLYILFILDHYFEHNIVVSASYVLYVETYD